MEGVPVMKSLRSRASFFAHTTYLNRRDTLRNKGDPAAPSRWNKYNMYHATYLNGSRNKCSTRIRGRECKQMYDGTTHAVNLAKGVLDETDRTKQSQCRLCAMRRAESQIHTSTTGDHLELLYISKNTDGKLII